MALNPQIEGAVPSGLGYSQGAGSGDRSASYKGQGAATVLSGLGNALETAATAADQAVQNKIYAEAEAGVNDVRTLFGVDAATEASAQTPPELDNAKGDLSRLQAAYESGALKASHYYGRLNVITKQLKNRYPGYEQQVDSIIDNITGVNPANSLVSSLRAEAEAEANAKSAAQSKFETWTLQNQEYIERARPGYFQMSEEIKPTPEQVMNDVAQLKAQDYDIQRQVSELELMAKEKTLSDDTLVDGARNVSSMISQQIVAGSLSVLGPNYQKAQQMLSEAAKNPASFTPQQKEELQMTLAQLQLNATNEIQSTLSQGVFATLDPTVRSDLVKDAMTPIVAMIDALNNEDYGLIGATAAMVEAQKSAAARELVELDPTISMIMAVKQELGPEAFSIWLSEGGGMNALTTAVELAIKAKVATGNAGGLNDEIQPVIDTPGVPKQTVKNVIDSQISIINTPGNPLGMIWHSVKFLYGAGSEGFIEKFSDEQQPSIFGTMYAPQTTETLAALKKSNPASFESYKKSMMTAFQQVARPVIADINGFGDEYTNLIEVSFNQSTGQLEVRPKEGAMIPGQIAGLEQIPQDMMIKKYKDLNMMLLSLKTLFDVEGQDFGAGVETVLQSMGVRYSNPLSPDERQERPDLSKRKVSEINPTVNDLLTFVSTLEAPGGFNQVSGGGYVDLENMTIQEVIDYQGEMVKSGATPSSAVGGMQIIRRTLAGLVEKHNLTGKEFFTEDIQRQLGVALMEGRGLNEYLRGEITADEFADNLASEWAALPLANGKSRYAGVGSNKALTDRDTLMAEISKLSGQSAMSFQGVDLAYWEPDPNLKSEEEIDELTSGDQYNSEGELIEGDSGDIPALDALKGGAGEDTISPANAQIRIRQIQYDMSQARKRGEDTSSDAWNIARGEILRLQNIIKESKR